LIAMVNLMRSVAACLHSAISGGVTSRRENFPAGGNAGTDGGTSRRPSGLIS
jgi:hypothetical protein